MFNAPTPHTHTHTQILPVVSMDAMDAKRNRWLMTTSEETATSWNDHRWRRAPVVFRYETEQSTTTIIPWSCSCSCSLPKLEGSVHRAISISLRTWINHAPITHTCRHLFLFIQNKLPQARLEPPKQSGNLYEFGCMLYLQATTAG